MGIYVKGIELPKEPDEMIELAIFGDGKTLKTGESWRSPVDRKCYYGTSEDMNTYSEFAVPPHGRLIDADALEQEAQKRLLLCEKHGNQFQKPYEILRAINEAPTVIEAGDEDV